MNIKLLTEHYLEFLSLKGGCTGWFGSRLVKMSHCWKLHAAAHLLVAEGSKPVFSDRNSSVHTVRFLKNMLFLHAFSCLD